MTTVAMITTTTPAPVSFARTVVPVTTTYVQQPAPVLVTPVAVTPVVTQPGPTEAQQKQKLIDDFMGQWEKSANDRGGHNSRETAALKAMRDALTTAAATMTVAQVQQMISGAQNVAKNQRRFAGCFEDGGYKSVVSYAQNAQKIAQSSPQQTPPVLAPSTPVLTAVTTPAASWAVAATAGLPVEVTYGSLAPVTPVASQIAITSQGHLTVVA